MPNLVPWLIFIVWITDVPLPQEKSGEIFLREGGRLYTSYYSREVINRGTAIIRGNTTFVKPLNKFKSGVSGHSCKRLILILSILKSWVRKTKETPFNWSNFCDILHFKTCLCFKSVSTGRDSAAFRKEQNIRSLVIACFSLIGYDLKWAFGTFKQILRIKLSITRFINYRASSHNKVGITNTFNC